MIKKIKIFDMDGTIIDSSHRYRTDETGKKIDLNFWIENDIPEKIMADSFLPLMEWVKRDIENPEIYVIFATARGCETGDGNYKFLEHHGIMPDKFIHRQGRSDSRGGAELKIQAFIPLLNLKQFKHATVHIYEDNIAYLQKMVNAVYSIGRPVVGHFIPSVQGH